MQFGVTFVPHAISELVECAQAAERYGFSHVGIGDAPFPYREVWTSCTAVALATSRVRIGPRVTNAVTRHPSVTAAAVATLDEISGGRAFLGLGTGDSAVRGIGLAASSIAELEACIRAIQGEPPREELGSGGALPWARPSTPIYVAASGPRALRLAGRVADGVIVHSGLLDENVQWARAQVELGACDAGRSMREIELWWFPFCFVDTGGGAAEGEVLDSSLASVANLLGRGNPAARQVPPELHDACREFAARYDYRKHVSGSSSENTELLKRLGLLYYLRRRYAIAGTPDECRNEVARLEQAGVERLWMSVHFADKVGFLSSWHQHVMLYSENDPP